MSLDDVFRGGSHDMPPSLAGSLSVEVAHEDSDCAVVFVRGELDRSSIPVMAGHLSATFAAGGTDRVVVVNLAGATFVDVAGLCFLFEAAGWATEHGSRLYLAGCSAHLVRLLNLTDLFDGLDVIPAQ